MTDIRFGTDGWRGRIAGEYTFDNVRRCAQGFASYMLGQGKRGEKIIVGFDKRFASEYFGAAVAEVLAANGFHVRLTEDATPTPVISYSVVAERAAGAVNITASHNPPWDNGFKVRDEHGGAIAPEGLAEIESRIPDKIVSGRTIEPRSRNVSYRVVGRWGGAERQPNGIGIHNHRPAWRPVVSRRNLCTVS